MLVLDGTDEQWFLIFDSKKQKIGQFRAVQRKGHIKIIFDFPPQYRIVREKLLESGEPVRLLQ